MAANFPNSPNTNDTFTSNGVTFTWDGEAWKQPASPGVKGLKGQKGEVGQKGQKGDGGDKGQKGEIGESGNPGGDGTDGDKGQKGDAGSDGNDGSDGTSVKGDKGEKGTDGDSIKGVKGDSVKGQKGESGDSIKGQKGELGQKGQKGDSIKGQKGEAGADGNDGTGIKGNKGEEGNFGGVSFDYTYRTVTTDSDPGGGNLRLNNTNFSSATFLYIDDVDNDASNIESYIRTIDDSTSTLKGHFRISNKANYEDYAIFTINGTSTEATGYHKIPCSYLSGDTSLPNDTRVIITFARTGDMGEKGQKGEPSTVKGQKGEAGADGNDGSDGTSVKGDKGQKGDSIKGQKGEPGADGNDGSDGTSVKGNKGDKGQKGDSIKGQKGEAGADGNDGSDGTSVKGQKGDSIKGQKGDKGQKGEAGADGTDGSDGTTGTQGDKAGLRYNYGGTAAINTTNPGSGKLQLNTSAGFIKLDYETADGTDVHEFVEKWDDSNSTVKGYIFITSNTNDSSQYYIVQLTGITDYSGGSGGAFLQLNFSNPEGTAPSTTNAELVVNFSRTGDKGETGADNSTKGQKGEPGADNSTKGQKGDTGSANTTQANTVKVNTSTENEYHNITFVPKDTTNGSFQTLEIDSTDQRLAWNPSSNTLNSFETQSYYFRTWAGSLGNSGQVLTTGGSGAGWSWSDPSDLTGYITVANQSDNRLITATGTTDSLNGETNLTFDGSTLAVTGALTANYSVTNSLSGSISLGTSHIGKLLFFTGTSTITIPNNVFTDGQVIAIYNNSSSSLTLTPGSSVVLRWAGTSLTGSRTINTRALVNIICVSGTSPDEFILSGTGIT